MPGFHLIGHGGETWASGFLKVPSDSTVKQRLRTTALVYPMFIALNINLYTHIHAHIP